MKTTVSRNMYRLAVLTVLAVCCTIAAPASRQRSASALISAELCGTCGFASRVVWPLIAASMMVGRSSGIRRPPVGRLFSHTAPFPCLGKPLGSIPGMNRPTRMAAIVAFNALPATG